MIILILNICFLIHIENYHGFDKKISKITSARHEY
jgi:hypothetical protein